MSSPTASTTSSTATRAERGRPCGDRGRGQRTLDTPIEDEFRVNTLSLGWDDDRNVIIIECIDRDPDESPEESAEEATADALLPAEPRLIRVVLSPARARAFARRLRRSSQPAAHRARSAGDRSRSRDTSVHGPTGTGAEHVRRPQAARRR